MLQPKVNWRSVGITTAATFIGCLLALGIVAFLTAKFIKKTGEELNEQLVTSFEEAALRAASRPVPAGRPVERRRAEAPVAGVPTTVVRDENEEDKKASAEVLDDQNREDPQA